MSPQPRSRAPGSRIYGGTIETQDLPTELQERIGQFTGFVPNPVRDRILPQAFRHPSTSLPAAPPSAPVKEHVPSFMSKDDQMDLRFLYRHGIAMPDVPAYDSDGNRIGFRGKNDIYLGVPSTRLSGPGRPNQTGRKRAR